MKYLKMFLIFSIVSFVSISCRKLDPVANFSFDATYFYAPNDVVFKNLSTDATEYNWEFGDGTNSIDENPTHQYKYGGVFTVTLTVKNKKGKTSIMSKQFIVLSAPNNLILESVILEDKSQLQSNASYSVIINGNSSSIVINNTTQPLNFIFTNPIELKYDDYEKFFGFNLVGSNQPKSTKNFFVKDFVGTTNATRYPKQVEIVGTNNYKFKLNLNWN